MSVSLDLYLKKATSEHLLHLMDFFFFLSLVILSLTLLGADVTDEWLPLLPLLLPQKLFLVPSSVICTWGITSFRLSLNDIRSLDVDIDDDATKPTSLVAANARLNVLDSQDVALRVSLVGETELLVLDADGVLERTR